MLASCTAAADSPALGPVFCSGNFIKKELKTMEFLVTGDAGQLHSCSGFTSSGSCSLLWKFHQEIIKNYGVPGDR